MKPWLFVFAGSAVFVGTILGGWLHGPMAKRLGGNGEMEAAASKLAQPLAEQHGNWRLVKETPFSADVVRMLECPAHISRAYVHQQTGDRIDVAVIVGPPGPVAVHTPEICFGSQDFAIGGDRTPIKVIDRNEQEHELWQVAFEHRRAAMAPLRVLYGWGTGASWAAASNPRIAHAGEPYLYKIQIAGPTSKADDEFKPCEDFLSWFLPEIQKRLLSTQEDAAAISPPGS